MYVWLQGTFWGDKVLYTGGYMCENRSRRGIHGRHQQYFLAGQCNPGFTVSFFSQRPLVKHVHPNKDSITYGVILETLSDAHTFSCGLHFYTEQNKTRPSTQSNITDDRRKHYHVTFRFIFTLEEDSGINMGVDDMPHTPHSPLWVAKPCLKSK